MSSKTKPSMRHSYESRTDLRLGMLRRLCRAVRYAGPSNLRKDPDDWVTGDERMTDAQASYLKTLSEEVGQELDDTLTKADASKRIEELQAVTGRGSSGKEANA